MNTIRMLVAGAAALSVLACGRDAATTTDTDLANDLKLAADASLQLANQQAGMRYSPTEVAPASNPAPASRVRQAPTGTRAISSPSPTIAAEPAPTVASTVEIPQVQVVEHVEAATTVVEELPAVPRPIPAHDGQGDYGSGGGVIYGGNGPGVIIINNPGPRTGGVVIRGGGRDDDNCELHDILRGRRPPQPRSGPIGVYVPNPGRPSTPVAGSPASIGRPTAGRPTSGGGAVSNGGAGGGSSTMGVPRRTRGGSE